MVAGFQSQFPPICDWNPPYCSSSEKIQRLSFIRQGEQKNKNKIFLSHKNKDRKIKRKNQTTVLSKKESSKGFQKNRLYAKDTVRATLHRKSVTTTCAQTTRNSQWITDAFSPVGYVTGMRVGAWPGVSPIYFIFGRLTPGNQLLHYLKTPQKPERVFFVWRNPHFNLQFRDALTSPLEHLLLFLCSYRVFLFFNKSKIQSERKGSKLPPHTSKRKASRFLR